MKKVFKKLVCIGLVFLLSTSIVFAVNDDENGGGAGGNSVVPFPTSEVIVK